MLKTILKNKTPNEQAGIKSDHISSLALSGKFLDEATGITMDILGVKKFEENGIEVYAKAWKDGEQLGFGADGSIETERFIFINPRIMVPDGTKKQVQEGESIQTIDNFKESPVLALQRCLAETMKVSARAGKIEVGSIGHSTLTVYPDAGTGATTVNGRVYRTPTPTEIWATIIAGAGNGTATSEVSNRILRFDTDSVSTKFTGNYRSIFTYDTSSMGAGATISSATISFFGLVTTTVGLATPTINVFAATPAANNALQNSDYGQIASTKLCNTDILFSGWSTSAYNDFALNASGLANISPSGVSKFGARESTYDSPASSPGWSSGIIDEIFCYFADQTGTTNDPKLVVNYTAATSFATKILLMGTGKS